MLFFIPVNVNKKTCTESILLIISLCSCSATFMPYIAVFIIVNQVKSVQENRVIISVSIVYLLAIVIVLFLLSSHSCFFSSFVSISHKAFSKISVLDVVINIQSINIQLDVYSTTYVESMQILSPSVTLTAITLYSVVVLVSSLQ